MKNKSKKKIVGVSLLLLFAIYTVLYLTTPSVSSYYYQKNREDIIAGLEIPLLADGDTLTIHTGYSLVYNEEIEGAKWVAYHLTKDELFGLFERDDNFRRDPLIETESASLEDYRKSGFDRGHLIPAADATWSALSMSETFYLSNMSPQEPSFNRGIWADLEAVVRNFAYTNQEVYIATGPIFYPGISHKTIGLHNVMVPDAYFKVILDYQEPVFKAIGFILENKSSNKPLEEFALSVDDVEKITNIDFFPLLENSIEESLESTFDVSLWDFNTFSVSKGERREYLANKKNVAEEIAPVQVNESFSSLLLGIIMESKKEIDRFLHNY